MASTNRINLVQSLQISENGTTFSCAITVNKSNDDIMAVLTISSYTDGSYNTVIQHSADNENWMNLVTIPQANDNEAQYVPFPTTGHLFYIRAKTTASFVISGATIQVDLYTETSRD